MNTTPRYQQLATLLRQAIKQEEYPIGSHLPTEHMLCHTHNVSRHTARAALQILEDEKLIKRRRGAGTQVVSKGTPPAFVQPLDGMDDLLQYAREASFNILYGTKLIIPGESSHDPEASHPIEITDGPWIKLDGVRTIEKKAIAATTVYVRDGFGDDPTSYQNISYAITEYLHKKHGIRVKSITQTITADQLNQEDAHLLNAPLGSPILKTIRRYFDETGRLFVLSTSRHPADGFAYEMTYHQR